uniref:Thioredoxin domain-containing protein n=1 Tax=Pyrodinium bahamense TaxID=73915 RepID=A0A7R9ZYQ8_9DINO|mmetsp:Transcript_15534/g.42924  ORF Transcript_15534/g.42924 Transcript_15534/m.42924 type:complete len:201 (+) Transcript_15534:91-693(+)
MASGWALCGVLASLALSALTTPVGDRRMEVLELPRASPEDGPLHPRCLPMPSGTPQENATVLLRGSVTSPVQLAAEIQEVTHDRLFQAMQESHVFVSLYTSWCPTCQLWLLEGGPLEQLARLVHERGLEDTVRVLKLNIDTQGVDRRALRNAGFRFDYVPAIFAIKRGRRPALYTGTSLDGATAIFAWIESTLELNASQV